MHVDRGSTAIIFFLRIHAYDFSEQAKKKKKENSILLTQYCQYKAPYLTPWHEHERCHSPLLAHMLPVYIHYRVKRRAMQTSGLHFAIK